MKQRLRLALVAMMLVALGTTSAWAQAFGKVSGVCKDAEGKQLRGGNEGDEKRLELPRATARLGSGVTLDDR